jgi:Cache domain
VPQIHSISQKWALSASAAGLALVVVIGAGGWNHSRTDRTEARQRALGAARSIAEKIDAQFVGLESLLSKLSVNISTNPDDVDANDALLHHEQSELPSSIANILVLSPDGRNIGNAVGRHANAGDRDYFKRALAGNRVVVGAPIRSRSDLGWVIPVARPVTNNGGTVQAVLVVAIFADSFRELIDGNELPVGSLVRIVADNEIEVAFVSNESTAIGPDLNRMGSAPRQFRLGEGSELLNLNGNLIRVIGFSTPRRVPWLVTVGLPTEIGSVRIAERTQ